MATYAYMRNGQDKDDWLIEQSALISVYGHRDLFIDEEGENEAFWCLMSKLLSQDTIIVRNLSLLGLERVELVNCLQKLNELNIRLISTDDGIDTGKTRFLNFYEIFLCLLKAEKAVLAQNKQKRIGIIGRPRTKQMIVEKIVFLRNEQKLPIREIARVCKVSIGTVHKYINQ